MIYKILFAASLLCFNTIAQADSTANSKLARQPANVPHSSLTTTVKIADKIVVLSGNQQVTGNKAPQFTVVDERFNPVTLADFAGKILVISTVPSIDTGTCSLQTKRFNDLVAEFPNQVKMLTISADLPFAQKRFCYDEGVSKVQLLSDSVWRDFALKYGLLIKDMGLLTRSVIIIDQQGIIRYQQIVEQLSLQPDYDQVLLALQSITDETPEPTENEPTEPTPNRQ